MDEIGFDFRQLVPILIVLVALLGLVFVVADWEEMQSAVMQATWRPIPYALAATLISYACISFSFAQVSRLMGVPMRSQELVIVGYVSAVLNHIVMSGGAAGYSVRYMLMNRYGVTMREVVAISILHFYLTALLMVAALPFGLVYVGLKAAISQTATVILGAFALIMVAVVVVATVLIFRRDMRERVVQALVRVTHRVLGRDISEPLGRFDATMAQGVRAMRDDPPSMGIIAVLVVTDWAFSALALYFCLGAFDVAPSMGELISGFVIGTVAGQATVLPGGLGTQEASLSGVFALYGYPFERAALASVLYRVLYSVIPYVISLGFYWLVLRRQTSEGHSMMQGRKHENPNA